MSTEIDPTMPKRDPEATRQRILDAALTEFCAKGLDGARVDEIAALSGVNKRMIYHYFGDKEGLFRALLKGKAGQTAEDRGAAEDFSLPEALAHWQAHQFADEEWTRLITWEALTYGAEDIVNETERTRGWAGLVEAIRMLQQEGHWPDDLDAGQLQLSLVALVTFPIAFPQYTKMITGRAPNDPEFLKERQEFLRALGALIEKAP